MQLTGVVHSGDLRRPLSTSLVRQVAAVNNAGQLPLGLLMCANMGTIVNDEIR